MSDSLALRAYAASAEALKQNMLAHASDLLGLDLFMEGVAEDDRTPYCVRVHPWKQESFPLMDVSLKPYRRRGPGSTIEVMIRAIERLARARVWQRHETATPPFGIMHASAIVKAIVERAGVSPQAFLDATWTSVAMGDKYAATADWRSDGPPPALLSRDPVTRHAPRALPDGLPWMSGYSTLDSVFIEAVALSDEVVIFRRPQWGSRFEIRLTPGLPFTTAQGLIGEPLRRLVSHPILNRFDLQIRAVTHHQRSVRFQVDGRGPWARLRFKGGNDHRREVADEIKLLRPGRRQLEILIERMLTVPGCKGDIDVAWQADFEIDDDFDAFVGKEIERNEFEGIMSRRNRAIRDFVDDDPIIKFDEDDPASYTP